MSDSGIQLTFLDWRNPVLPAVADHLLAGIGGSDIWDSSGTTVLVPTKEAGRRLREALAYRASQRGTGLFPPRVRPVHSLLEAAVASSASPLQVQLALARILLRSRADAFPDLFPAGSAGDAEEDDRFALALRAARPLCELRSLLTEGGILFREVPERAGEGFEDTARWEDLARLEEELLAELGALGLEDPLVAARRAAENPRIDEGTHRVVVAAVPDLPSLAERALRRLAESIPVEILVHAPAEEAEAFDEAGRPRAEVWPERKIAIADSAIRLVADSQAQAVRTRELLAPRGDEADGKPLPAAVGVPDERVIPALRAELAEAGISAFDPGGHPLMRHPLTRLARTVGALALDDRFEDAAALFRHPDVLDALLRRNEGEAFSISRLLVAADTVQNERLPQSFSRFAEVAKDAAPELALAVETLRETVAQVRDAESVAEGLRAAMTCMVSGRVLEADSLRDREFQAVARQLVDILDSVADLCDSGWLPERRDQQTVLNQLLENARYYFPEPGDAVPDVELQGWLELHWNDAPNLVLTGVNDHVVPESVVGHAFLPDSLRTTLVLTNNERRLTRDAYLLQTLLACREGGGGTVRILLGKQSPEGDVLRPSRLLFHCEEEHLPQRALELFGPGEPSARAPQRQTSWKLKPPPVAEARLPKRLRVTSFRDYLACPFRFYLRHVLGMEACDDRKREMDALDFGTVCHLALKEFGRNRDLRESTDSDRIAAYLIEVAQTELARRYGPNPPAAVLIQCDSMAQRLRGAARVQARQRSLGWQILDAEVPLDPARAAEFSPLPISGTVDRVDRHEEDGTIRLLDYKTTDTPKPPATVHLATVREHTPGPAIVSVGGKERAWADLQLPLYAKLYAAPDHRFPLCGYFNLPKAVTQTDVALWNALSEDLIESAARCAGEIARRVRDGVFWPPVEGVRHDDFAGLFFDTVEDSVEPL